MEAGQGEDEKPYKKTRKAEPFNVVGSLVREDHYSYFFCHAIPLYVGCHQEQVESQGNSEQFDQSTFSMAGGYSQPHKWR